MTTPAGLPPSPSPGPPPGAGVGVGALIVLVLAAGAIFWAGLSLGAGSAGRNEQERAAIAAFTEAYQRIADDFIGTPLPTYTISGFTVQTDGFSANKPGRSSSDSILL